MDSTSIEFLSKDGPRVKHPTYWLAIEARGPQALKRANAIALTLQAEGWTRGVEPSPLPDGTQFFTLNKPGTGLFNGWTDEERKSNLAQARKVLRLHEYRNVPARRLTLAECL
jgi:hypothetical protein